MSTRKHWRYKNISLFVLSLTAALFLSRQESFHTLLLSLNNWGYLGAFIAGALFVSSFTFSTGIVVLLVLAEKLNRWEIGLIAGLGAVCGDLLIFHFVRDELIQEVKPLYNKFGGKHLTALLHSKYFSWTLPVVGALIITSPLSDEIGVSLMGLSKMKKYQFVVISFILNAIGILLVIEASRFITP